MPSTRTDKDFLFTNKEMMVGNSLTTSQRKPRHTKIQAFTGECRKHRKKRTVSGPHGLVQDLISEHRSTGASSSYTGATEPRGSRTLAAAKVELESPRSIRHDRPSGATEPTKVALRRSAPYSACFPPLGT